MAVASPERLRDDLAAARAPLPRGPRLLARRRPHPRPRRRLRRRLRADDGPGDGPADGRGGRERPAARGVRAHGRDRDARRRRQAFTRARAGGRAGREPQRRDRRRPRAEPAPEGGPRGRTASATSSAWRSSADGDMGRLTLLRGADGRGLHGGRGGARGRGLAGAGRGGAARAAPRRPCRADDGGTPTPACSCSRPTTRSRAPTPAAQRWLEELECERPARAAAGRRPRGRRARPGGRGGAAGRTRGARARVPRRRAWLVVRGTVLGGDDEARAAVIDGAGPRPRARPAHRRGPRAHRPRARRHPARRAGARGQTRSPRRLHIAP